jgi:hypothetical protein
MFFDAYRGSQFLAQPPYVDRNRLAMIGFSRGGGIALRSVDGSAIQQLFADKSSGKVDVFIGPVVTSPNGKKGVRRFARVMPLPSEYPSFDQLVRDGKLR